jgi:hypothetical protein
MGTLYSGTEELRIVVSSTMRSCVKLDDSLSSNLYEKLSHGHLMAKVASYLPKLTVKCT